MSDLKWAVIPWELTISREKSIEKAKISATDLARRPQNLGKKFAIVQILGYVQIDIPYAAWHPDELDEQSELIPK
jgi:hypothetical protein